MLSFRGTDQAIDTDVSGQTPNPGLVLPFRGDVNPQAEIKIHKFPNGKKEEGYWGASAHNVFPIESPSRL